MSVEEQRLLRILLANLAGQVVAPEDSLQFAADVVWSHPQVRDELQELFDVLRDTPSHVHQQALPTIPLQVHSRYTRIEILAAVGEGRGARTPRWQEGVYDAKGVGADLLAFTLDKTSGDFSPTTRYRDYAISRDLIHWESQSGTRADSEASNPAVGRPVRRVRRRCGVSQPMLAPDASRILPFVRSLEVRPPSAAPSVVVHRDQRMVGARHVQAPV
jgi:hypothetical protein